MHGWKTTWMGGVDGWVYTGMGEWQMGGVMYGCMGGLVGGFINR
jgi:hypothetical protein